MATFWAAVVAEHIAGAADADHSQDSRAGLRTLVGQEARRIRQQKGVVITLNLAEKHLL